LSYFIYIYIYDSHTRLAIVRKMENAKFRQEHVNTASEHLKPHNHFTSQSGGTSNVKQVVFMWYSSCTPRFISREMKTDVQRKTYISRFIGTLFTITKNGRMQVSTDWWMAK
jgi:hypothetical protein